MDDGVPGEVNARIAAQVRTRRGELGLSLAALAAASGVSRSALSLIERGRSSPTAVVLDRIAAGLGVPLESLFAGGDDGNAGGPVSRRADQPVWRDPGTGYLRRSVSPGGGASPIQIVEVRFPPGARIVFETSRGRVIHQHLWVLEGTIECTVDGRAHRLDAGDCLASRLDRPTIFHNPTRRPARYALVAVPEGGIPR